MNPNVDVVDILSVHELAQAPGTASASWELVLCNPATGTSYRITGTDFTAIISDIIGSGVIDPDRVYVVDRGQPDDPVSGGNTVNDTYLDGKVFSLELRGVGFLEKGVEWDNDVSGGGWRLLGGTTFNSAEFYTVHFHPQISDIIASPNAIGKFSDGVQLISSNTSVTTGMFRKLMVLTGGYTVTLNASYPENVIHPYTHNGTSNKQAVLTAPGGQSFSWNGGTTSTLWLGKNERVGLIRSDNTWYVVYDTMGYDRVGHIVPGRLPGANQIVAQGQTVLRSDYPRLLDYITRLNAAYPGSVVNAAQWANNKTRWGFGDGSTTIQVPLLLGQFLRWLDMGTGIDVDRIDAGTHNIPGSGEDMSVEEHNHYQDGNYDKLLKASDGTPFTTAATFGGTRPSTFPDVNSYANIIDYGGSETRPVNAAELPLIYV